MTLLSPTRKKISDNKKFRPSVSIIIPIWNEGSANGERLRKTVDSLLTCDYPKEKLEIIIVNDGSTDNSLEIAHEYRKKYGVKVYSHKKSKGKTLAVNTGTKHAKGELVAALDADSFIMPDVIDKLVPCFQDPQVMAAIPSIKIWKPKSILQYIQFQEFLSAVFVRHLQAELGSIPLAPGAFTLIRKSFIDKYGSLNPNTMVEDLEMSMRIQSEHYLIENVIDANVYTSGVTTFKAFVSQRLRWFAGFLIQIKRYKHLFSTEYGNLGVFILPVSIIYVILTVVVFLYSLVMLAVNTIHWWREIYLVGFDFANLFEITWDLYFVTLSNTTVIPIVLLIITFIFMYYIKKISKEKQKILVPFIVFIFTYWFVGPLCWVLAIYYYVRKKKIRWGPNYFTT